MPVANVVQQQYHATSFKMDLSSKLKQNAHTLYKVKRLSCVHKHNMEPVETLTLAQSKYFSELYIYSCVRNPGYVYEFSRLRDKKYNCCGCKKLKKTRCITIENNAVVGSTKHPEDDHHPDCQPIPESGTEVSLTLIRYSK